MILYDTDGKQWDRGNVRVMRGKYFGRAVQARDGDKVVALVPQCHADDDADARLIAAAPDLLAALAKCVAMLVALKAESGRSVEWGEEDAFRMGEWFEVDDLRAVDAARAAIAKAPGDAT